MNCQRPGCGHQDDEHDHLSGNTRRRDCEEPGCGCRDLIYRNPRTGVLEGSVLVYDPTNKYDSPVELQ